jgi:pimeloyl-ACP methyl ester carboxylesterase
MLVAPNVNAQRPGKPDSDSLPNVEHVVVQQGVSLEVLDWGGTGRPVVLLAGLGNTAYVFDDFARKLTASYRVYGITRRGYGNSSKPIAGYDADRLADDVLAVIDSLGLDRPVLIGHSIAGEELSSIGSRHPERVAGLVYLDAAYDYAYYDSTAGSYELDLPALQQKLERLAKDGPDQELLRELVQSDLPLVERDARAELDLFDTQPPSAPPAVPATADMASFTAYHDWLVRTNGVAMPVVELRQGFVERPDHSVGAGKFRIAGATARSITEGERKYHDIRAPMLAIFASPHDRGPRIPIGPEKSAADARDSIRVDAKVRRIKRGIPSATIFLVPHANHYVFLSNESDVVREVKAFIAGLR